MIEHIGNAYLILSSGPIQHVYYIKSIGRPLAHLKQYNLTILSMLLSHIWTEGALKPVYQTSLDKFRHTTHYTSKALL